MLVLVQGVDTTDLFWPVLTLVCMTGPSHTGGVCACTGCGYTTDLWILTLNASGPI